MKETKNDSKKVIYLEKLLNRFKFNNDFKNGFMFFLGGSILLPKTENEIEQLQIASQQISEFDINKEYEEILGPLRDIYIKNFFEEYIWRLDVKIETRKFKIPDTSIEVSEFKFKNHKRLDKKETKIQNFFENETVLNRMLEGVGKELSSQGYQLKRSFEAGNCFFNLKAQVDRSCTTELINTINSNLSPIVDWITMVGRTPTVTLSEKYLDIQIALRALIRGEDREFSKTLWGFQSYVLYHQQKEIAGISNLSSEEFQKHCRNKAILYCQSVEKEPLVKLAKKKKHITMFPPLVSQVKEKHSFNDAFKENFGNPKSQGYHCDVHLKCLIIYSYFNVVCETVLSSMETNQIDFQLTKELAESGDCIAQYNLALKYTEDPIIKKDLNEGIRLLKLSSKQGFIPAHNQLGDIYENGLGTEQNYSEAFKYYKIASDSGDLKGQFALGCLYQHGLGVEKDYIEAVRLYKLSADQGFMSGYFNLGVMYHNGIGVEVNLKEAMKYYIDAAKKGHGRAFYNIGTIYAASSEYNIYTLAWFALAYQNGISSADGIIKELENEMSADQLAKTQDLLKKIINGSIDLSFFLGK